MMTAYYRVCRGVNDKGILVPEGSNFEQYRKGEAYVSVYKYNDSHYKHFKEKGTIAGITDVTTDILYFDFDSTDLEKSRQDAVTTVGRLVDSGIPLEDIRINFSGNKGLHLTIHTDKEMTPEQAKNVAMSYAGDLKTFDSVIYNPSRIIRLEGSIHGTTGLRKTPLTLDELKTLGFDQIKEIAKQEYEYEKPRKVSISKERMVTQAKVEANTPTKKIEVDYKNNPFDLFPMKLAISQGIYPNGQRNNALSILAATLRHKGLSKEDCYYLLKSAADKQSKVFGSTKTDKKELWNMVNTMYGDNWNDGTYAEDKFPKQLLDFFEEQGIPLRAEADLVSDKYLPRKIEHAEVSFSDFVQNYEKHLVKTGIASLDKAIPLTPGMNLGIVAAPGVGKTSTAIKILENCAKEGIYCLFASIDMNSMRLYEKLLYRVSGLSREELFQKIKAGEADEYKKKVNELLKTTYIYDRGGATIDDIRKYHRAIEKRDGIKIKMTMVDYFERVNSDVSEDTAASKKVAGEWQDYINDTGVVGVMYVQPSKMSISGGPNSPILDYRAIKGSSFLYQSFRGIISLWRPFYTPELAKFDKYMEMAILKNDLGELNKFAFGWDGKKGDIFELDEQGKMQFKSLMESINESPEDDY